ncbi:SET domain and MYND-type zinc finger protein 6 [Erysiphe neolycopersici]|uniref:SET domain and MYND-type zinc finger protein 6 n=1 Tax=Erysiphe neolycopersici TaxID=212602 RepID=A0A420HBT5_9PEZI|nr:SET domain and MYND-type zinc finger protein 6 [Erysiphe neolycopersici]
MSQTNFTKEIQTNGRGRGLAATQDISPHGILMNVHNPYILLPDTPSLSKICSWCFLPLFSAFPHLQTQCVATLQKCSACKIPRYCSFTCQRADWKSIHAKECKYLQKLPDVPPTPVRALMQALLKFQLDEKRNSLWTNLKGHEEERITRSRLGQEESWEDISLQAKAAMAFTSTEDLGLEMGIAILCRISCNAFRATLPDATPIGIFFEPTISLVNHSCVPNAHVVSEGRIMTLHSLLNIAAGEEIFISYVDVEQPCLTRRDQLWKTYFFWCECTSCKNELEKESLTRLNIV